MLEDGVVQSQHVEALRLLPSFRRHIDALVDAGRINEALPLLENDESLLEEVAKQMHERQQWATQLLRSLHLTLSSGIAKASFTELYMSTLAEGMSLSSEIAPWADAIRHMAPDEVIALVHRLLRAIEEGNADVALDPWYDESDDLIRQILYAEREIKALVRQAQDNGVTLRSKYSAQSKVLRTTVIAQKVQLSRDSAALTAEDKSFTNIADRLVEWIAGATACASADSLFLNEIWLYDSRVPHKDVFTPRLGGTLSRALSRPHDYLACSDGNTATLPATSILYSLYLEASAIVNVADLWAAFYNVIGEDSGAGIDERTGLVLFYRALAELKAMGFVKSSRKKADHIAKLKWL